jgi:hypothetical protein
VIEEILPGIFHWTQAHPKIGMAVSSYYLLPERVLIDPLIPDEGLEWFADHPPENILLSIRHHYRHCAEFEEKYSCKVWCVEQGLHEFTNGELVEAFNFGDVLPGSIRAVEIGSICPDEGALFINREGGCVVLADGCVRKKIDGPLQFVPDSLLGEDPIAVRVGLIAAYTHLLEEYYFEHVLLSHGGPIIADGRAQLEAFLRNSAPESVK